MPSSTPAWSSELQDSSRRSERAEERLAAGTYSALDRKRQANPGRTPEIFPTAELTVEEQAAREERWAPRSRCSSPRRRTLSWQPTAVDARQDEETQDASISPELERTAARSRLHGARSSSATVVRPSVRPPPIPATRRSSTRTWPIEGFVGGACASSTVRLHALHVLETHEPLLLRIRPGAEDDQTPSAR